MKRPEQNLQIEIVRWWDMYGNRKAMLHHSPNGGKRSAIEGAIFKRMGVRAGFPDLILLHRGQAYFIELKADAGKLTKKQEEIHDKLRAIGFQVAIVRSNVEFVETLKEWRII